MPRLCPQLASMGDKDLAAIQPMAEPGEGGRTFGSVSSKEIAAACMEQHNIEIDKKKILLPENLKNFGSYEISIKLHSQVTGKLTVKVVES